MNPDSTIQVIKKYGKPYASHFAWGLAATICVVAIRVGIPWIYKAALSLVLNDSELLIQLSPDWQPRLLKIMTAFVVMAAGLGLSEYWQRVSFKKYSAGIVHNMREKALESIARIKNQYRKQIPDTISRIISDTARIKAELSGILVHSLTHGLLFLSISILFLYLAPVLGLLLLAAGGLGLTIAVFARKKIKSITLKQRQKEGEFADVIESVIQGSSFNADKQQTNDESRQHEVKITKLISTTTWIIHIVVALTLAAALWTAFSLVMNKQLSTSNLVLFMIYGVGLQRRIVQLGRQVARSGKTSSNVKRLNELILPESQDLPSLKPPKKTIKLSKLRCKHSQNALRKPILSILKLTLPARKSIAVIGKPYDDISLLLKVLAGQYPYKGKIYWDTQLVSPDQLATTSKINYIGEPAIRRKSLSKLLAIQDISEIDKKAAQALQLKKFLELAPKGLETKVSSQSITPREALSLQLWQAIKVSPKPIFILDYTQPRFSRAQTGQMLDYLIAQSKGRSLIVGLHDSKHIDKFDIVIRLKNQTATLETVVSQLNT